MTVQRLETSVVPAWPRLAWLARLRPDEPAVAVLHGAGLEVADDWLCEAVWDDAFEAGGFDRTDVVAGSGVRLRHGRATFVSAGSTVDRLQSAHAHGAYWVSNSLPCLLEVIDGAPDVSYPRYYWDFRSITSGLRGYKRELATSAGPVTFTYFDNLAWDGTALERVRKPARAFGFTDFRSYRSFLASSLQRLAVNMDDAGRRHRFTMLSTASSGYDSPAVAVLAAEAGCEEILSFDRGRDEQSDSGEPIADALGLRMIRVDRDAWQARPLPEAPFLAGDAYGMETQFRGAEEHLANRLLMTGYYGGKIWGKPLGEPGADIERDDHGGLALTEYRLSAGFVHCPVPFFGARLARDVAAITAQAEMQAWDVPGPYSRPIPRRIVEQAGVPRESFGMSKRATAVVLHNSERFLTDESMERYARWLRDHRREWLKEGRIPPLLSPALDRAIMRASVVIGSPAVRRAPRRLARQLLSSRSAAVANGAPPLPQVDGRSAAAANGRRATAKTALRNLSRLEERARLLHLGPTYLRRFVFPWAIAETRRLYSLDDHGCEAVRGSREAPAL